MWRFPTLIRGLRFLRLARHLKNNSPGDLPDVARGAEQLIQLLQHSDLVVNYGSGGLNDIWSRAIVYPWSFCYRAAKLLGKVVAVTGQGIGPLTNSIDRRVLCGALNQVDAITVRDCKESAELLQHGGVRCPPVRIAADDACSLACAPGDAVAKALRAEGVPDARPLIALHFRPTGFDVTLGEQDCHLIAAAADALVERIGGHVVLVATSYDDVHGVDDREGAELVLQRMRLRQRATLLRGDYEPSLVKGIIADADLALGTSYHFLLFALTAGRPAFGFYRGAYYSRKLHGLFGLFALDRLVFDLARCDLASVVTQAVDAFENRGLLGNQLQRVTRQLEVTLDEVWASIQTMVQNQLRAQPPASCAPASRT